MMKKIFIILAIAGSSLFMSCDAESTENLSAITAYAVFEYEPLVVVAIGDNYTPNALASEDGNSLTVNIDGTADTNTVGVYNIVYSATNSDGFDGTVTQQVVVHDPSIIGTDVSGDIRDKNRPARTGVISLIEGTTSIFYATDFAYGGTFPVYFQMDGNTISDIPQAYVFGNDHIDLTYDPGSLNFTVYIPEIDFLYTFEYQ